MIRDAVAALLVLAAAVPAQEPPRDDAARLTDALNAFAVRLHERLGDEPTCAPASIAFALLMILPGARGETAAEIERLLALPADLRGERLLAAVQRLIATLTAPSRDSDRRGRAGTVVRLVDDVWVQQGEALVPGFATILAEHFGAAAHAVDFAGDPAAAKQQIDAAVAAATEGRVRELLPADLVTADTRLLLTNALWLRGTWLHRFHERGTRPAAFTRADGSTVEVPTMHLFDEHLDHVENERFQVVRLPFNDSAFVCDVVLPRTGTSLQTVEAEMLAGDYVPALASERVQVALPRFTVAGALRLRETLAALGAPAMFDASRADYSGIRTERKLAASDLVHRTWITVDENGVEAAAAAAYAHAIGMEPGEPKVFRADRPFAFVIRHRDGLVLFQGRVTDPSKRPR